MNDEQNPHTYGAGTRLSSAYTAGRDGLPMPKYLEKTSSGAKAWARGNREWAEEQRKEPLNQLDYADDPAEFEVQKEIRRLGIKNEPMPTACPTCKGELEQSGGFAGETILFCQKCQRIAWEDAEGAIRNVY